MRELFKKFGSVALGVGGLSLVLVNAAMTHGCAGSKPQATTPQAGSSWGPYAAAAGSSADPCQPPAYMYATKAPIWIPPGCPGGNPAPVQAQESSPPANAAQQAP